MKVKEGFILFKMGDTNGDFSARQFGCTGSGGYDAWGEFRSDDDNTSSSGEPSGPAGLDDVIFMGVAMPPFFGAYGGAIGASLGMGTRFLELMLRQNDSNFMSSWMDSPSYTLIGAGVGAGIGIATGIYCFGGVLKEYIERRRSEDKDGK
jgi:hypothetical protein